MDSVAAAEQAQRLLEGAMGDKAFQLVVFEGIEQRERVVLETPTWEELAIIAGACWVEHFDEDIVMLVDTRVVEV